MSHIVETFRIPRKTWLQEPFLVVSYIIFIPSTVWTAYESFEISRQLFYGELVNGPL